jgi:cytochrome c5
MAEEHLSSDHVSPIKTPQQLITVILLAFIVPIIVIVLLVKFVVGGASTSAGTNAMTPEEIAQRLRPVSRVDYLAPGASNHALLGGQAVFQQVCTACHGAGIAGAPKVGDKGAWSPRIAEGFDTLVSHATNGYKAMPAKGGDADLDPVEVGRAVAWMADQAGATFKEPDAPAAPAAGAAPAAAAPAPAAAK